MARPEPVKRFSIHWVNLDPTIGHEIKKNGLLSLFHQMK